MNNAQTQIAQMIADTLAELELTQTQEQLDATFSCSCERLTAQAIEAAIEAYEIEKIRNF